MSSLVPYRKYAVGYDRLPRGSFTAMLEPYLPAIREVYFAWPGMISGRALQTTLDPETEKPRLLTDLAWCRNHGIQLDLLFNANCYGRDAFGAPLRDTVYSVLHELQDNGLFPEIVTTTSQFIAKVIKVKHPEIDIRASVNMRLESTKAMEFISDLFDSFYICRDIQRDLPTLRLFHDWGEAHGKRICLLANSACIRCCPVQTWHDNFLCHENWRSQEQEFALRYPMKLCSRHFMDGANMVDYLRMSWIRPEDLHFYEPYVHTIKLATRRTHRPDLILKAYCEGHYDGDLLDFINSNQEKYWIDNTAFPADWVESGIAQNCALNCTDCGKCEAILKQVLRRKEQKSSYIFNF